MFERIVVGMDGSPAAGHAMEWAAALAGDTQLVLVHVGRWSVGVRLAGTHGGGTVAVVSDVASRDTELGVVAEIDGSAPGQEVVHVAADNPEATRQPITLLHAWAAPKMWEQDLAGYAGEFAEYEQMHCDTLAETIDVGIDYGGSAVARFLLGSMSYELLLRSQIPPD